MARGSSRHCLSRDRRAFLLENRRRGLSDRARAGRGCGGFHRLLGLPVTAVLLGRHGSPGTSVDAGPPVQGSSVGEPQLAAGRRTDGAPRCRSDSASANPDVGRGRADGTCHSVCNLDSCLQRHLSSAVTGRRGAHERCRRDGDRHLGRACRASNRTAGGDLRGCRGGTDASSSRLCRNRSPGPLRDRAFSDRTRGNDVECLFRQWRCKSLIATIAEYGGWRVCV